MSQLLREVTSTELTEWRAYYDLEPFGALMDDRRHGIATAVLANVNRDSKSKPDAYKETDFIYWHAANRGPQNDGGTLLKDPEAQSRLIKRMLFKA